MANTSPWNKTLAKQGWYQRNEIAITPWLFLVPGLIMFAIYVVFPILQSFPHLFVQMGWPWIVGHTWRICWDGKL